MFTVFIHDPQSSISLSFPPHPQYLPSFIVFFQSLCLSHLIWNLRLFPVHSLHRYFQCNLHAPPLLTTVFACFIFLLPCLFWHAPGLTYCYWKSVLSVQSFSLISSLLCPLFFFFLVWIDNFLWMGLLTTNTCLVLPVRVWERERSYLATSS